MITTPITREQALAFLNQCGNFTYDEMVAFIESVYFYTDSTLPSGGASFKFKGLWNNTDADANIYDVDSYVSYNQIIYRSTVNNNVSIPGTNSQWASQNDSTPAATAFKGEALTTDNPGTPSGASFWFAKPGVYPNFGNKTVTGSFGILYYNDSNVWGVMNIPLSTAYAMAGDMFNVAGASPVSPGRLIAINETPATSYAVTANTVGFFPTVEWQSILRGRTLIGIEINTTTAGTLSVWKATNVGTGTFARTLIKQFTIVGTGLKTLLFDAAITLASNEWLGVFDTADTARGLYKTPSAVTNPQNFWDFSTGAWLTVSANLCLTVLSPVLQKVDNDLAVLNGKMVVLEPAVTANTAALKLKPNEVNSDGILMRVPPVYAPVSGVSQGTSGYWRYDTGVWTALAGRGTSIKYPIDPTRANFVTGIAIGVVTALAVYFDASNNYLGYEFRGTSVAEPYTKKLLNPPPTAAFVGVSVGPTGSGTSILEIYSYPELVHEINTDGKIVRAKKNTYTPITGTRQVPDGYYRPSDGVYSTSSVRVSYLFPVDPTKEYVGTSNVVGAATCLAVYFTSAMVFISSQNIGTQNHVRTPLILPVNAAFVGMSPSLMTPILELAAYGDLAFTGGYESAAGIPGTLMDIYNLAKRNTEGKNLAVAGDSITAGISATRWVAVCVAALKFNSSTLHNVAIGGARWSKQSTGGFPTQNPDDAGFVAPASSGTQQAINNNCAVVHVQQLIAAVTAGAKPIPHVVVLAYGTNPDVNDGAVAAAMTGKTVDRNDTFDMCKAIRYCIQTIRSAYPDCKVFIALPLQTGDAVARNVRLTTIVNPSLIGIANGLSIPIIDCYNESGITEKFELGPPIGTGGSPGLYTNDGLHPNDPGGILHGKCMSRGIIRHMSII